jgi:4-methylaminobutanoate oxidase (formaldehyde-forming)
MPTLMLGEIPLYAREEHGGLLWSAGHGRWHDVSRCADDPSIGFAFDQIPIEALAQIREAARHAYPVLPRLAAARTATVSFGAPTYTPDGRALVGKVDGIAGLYLASGCNEGGVTHAPGFGRALADLIAHGSSTWCSLDPFAPSRFDGCYCSKAEVIAAVAG